jgi:hypothetical protein
LGFYSALHTNKSYSPLGTGKQPKSRNAISPARLPRKVRYLFVLTPQEFKNEFLKAEKGFFYFKSRFKKKKIVFLKNRLIFLKKRFFTEKWLVFF